MPSCYQCHAPLTAGPEEGASPYCEQCMNRLLAGGVAPKVEPPPKMDLLPKVELAPEVKPPLKIEPLPVEQPRPNQTQPAPLSVVVELLEARKPLPAEQRRIDQSPAPLSMVVELLKATEPADKPIRATTILILINVLVAAVMMIYTVAEGMKFPIFDRSHLLVFGADYGPYTLDYQYWRVITSSFLHWGFYHLFINMVALGFFGEAIDRLFDKKKYLFYMCLPGWEARF
ncbi:MAG: hypothetical protein DMG65_18185 [Candidatus Angelobacter sp. Gp1-AA117]|nr:MAG: hypothetical protein DMG65_18185 [Candidatus Angelobacter sp. Gp1-AA117]